MSAPDQPNHPGTAARPAKRYRLIPYLRIEPEHAEPFTLEEALSEKEQQELLSPENIYRIEEIPPSQKG